MKKKTTARFIALLMAALLGFMNFTSGAFVLAAEAEPPNGETKGLRAVPVFTIYGDYFHDYDADRALTQSSLLT